jgi:hypothetical protein
VGGAACQPEGGADVRFPHNITAAYTPPRRGIIEASNGDTRLGWLSDLHGAARGHPDVVLGTAQARDRIALHLVQAFGYLRVCVEIWRAFDRRPNSQRIEEL